MAYRILTAAAVFVALAAPVLAEDSIDLLHPECRNTPIAKLTLGQLKQCEILERILGGTDAIIAKARAQDAAEDARKTVAKAKGDLVRPECQKENACLKVWP